MNESHRQQYQVSLQNLDLLSLGRLNLDSDNVSVLSDELVGCQTPTTLATLLV